MQCQCIVWERSCGPSPYIFDMYLSVPGPQFENTGLENLEQLLYLCSFKECTEVSFLPSTGYLELRRFFAESEYRVFNLIRSIEYGTQEVY